MHPITAAIEVQSQTKIDFHQHKTVAGIRCHILIAPKAVALTVLHVVKEADISSGGVSIISHNSLGSNKVSAKWVPHADGEANTVQSELMLFHA